MRNPIHRLIAIGGLVLLLPIGYLLATGELTAQDAGIRAAIVLGVVVVVRRLARAGMTVVANSMERQAAEAPRRRSADSG